MSRSTNGRIPAEAFSALILSSLRLLLYGFCLMKKGWHFVETEIWSKVGHGWARISPTSALFLEFLLVFRSWKSWPFPQNWSVLVVKVPTDEKRWEICARRANAPKIKCSKRDAIDDWLSQCCCVSQFMKVVSLKLFILDTSMLMTT